MLRIIKLSPILILMSLFCGCLPTYQIEKGSPATKINVANLGNPMICINGKKYTLQSSNDYAVVPANQRVTITNPMTFQSYNMIYNCAPEISFIPRENKTYYAHIDVENWQCQISVFQEGGDNRVGLKLDHTVGRGSCPN